MENTIKNLNKANVALVGQTEVDMATQLDMAEQQLYGWSCAHAGERIEAMVSGMGLTMAEWQELVDDGRVEYLPEYVKAEITAHLSGE